MNTLDSTKRFSGRVDNYIKHRPRYPLTVLDFLTDDGVLTPDSLIADIGSGTGISTEIFLKNGNKVFGVEPNQAMREASQELLSTYANFSSINGSSEQTNLPENSVDLVTAFQSFHWFDPEKTRKEFKRILTPSGQVILAWNNRLEQGDDFLREYDLFIRLYSIDYSSVNHQKITHEDITAFFGSKKWKLVDFPNEQRLDFEGLKGRVLSCSYMIDEKHSQYDRMLKDIRYLYEKHQEYGWVTLYYTTSLFIGTIN